MAKAKNLQAANNAEKDVVTEATKATLFELRDNREIWYRIQVLIYDLSNIKMDRSSESRIERTVDELYISEPYFTAAEAAFVKAALVQIDKATPDNTDIEITPNNVEITSEKVEDPSSREDDSATKELKTVKEAIKERLSNFYDKRKASGDFRPCGPHDMAPVYLSVFGIPRSELEDESFLGRLRRSGLEDLQEKPDVEKTDKKKKLKKGR